MNTATIGSCTLNLSFYLYLLVYLPQLVHNHRQKHLSQLSLCLHFSLYLAYILDLIYAFLHHLPWQYKTVSIVGSIMLSVQHGQLIRLYWQRHQRVKLRYLALFSLMIIIMLGCHYPHVSIPYIGYSSRILFLLYLIPLLMHNTRAISNTYLQLSMILSILDLISACCLDWGWPNKIGPLLSLILLAKQMVNSVNDYKSAALNPY